MTTRSRKPAQSGLAGGRPGPAQGDEPYRARPEGRLSPATEPPGAAPPQKASVPPPPLAPTLRRPPRVESDVHALPPEDDELGAADDGAPYVVHDSSRDPFAEFEEMEGEATRIDTQHLIAEQSTHILEEELPAPYLQVDQGKDIGKDFALNPGETTIGRSIDNDIILTDLAVSRRHLRIVRGDDDVLRMHDMGSGNGTLVNGERGQDLILSEGDRIQIGETSLVVCIPAPDALEAKTEPRPRDAYRDDGSTTDESMVPSSLVPPPGPPRTPTDFLPHGASPSPTTEAIVPPRVLLGGSVVIPRPWLIAILIVGGVSVALLGATVTAVVMRGGGSTPATADGPPGDPGRFERGVGAYQAHRWDDAERIFRQVLATNPSDARAQLYLERIRDARQHDVLLHKARQALAQHDYATAINDAAGVPSTSPLADEATRVRQQAGREQVGALIHAARKAHAGDHDDTARRKLEEARTIAPDDPRIVDALDDMGLGGEGQQEPSSVHHHGHHHGHGRVPGPARVHHTEPASRGGGNVAAGIEAAYRSGDFARAASLARSEGKRDLAQDIQNFAHKYARIQRAGHNTDSVRPLIEDAIIIDRRIGHGYYTARFKAPLIASYLNAARAALSHHDAVTACRRVRQILGLDPSDGPAHSLARTCESNAAGLVRQAAGLESSSISQAEHLYRNVLVLVPQSSPSYQKALARLRALRLRHGTDEDE